MFGFSTAHILLLVFVVLQLLMMIGLALSSKLTDMKKMLYISICWFIPILGTLIVLILLKRDGVSLMSRKED